MSSSSRKPSLPTIQTSAQHESTNQHDSISSSRTILRRLSGQNRPEWLQGQQSIPLEAMLNIELDAAGKSQHTVGDNQDNGSPRTDELIDEEVSLELLVSKTSLLSSTLINFEVNAGIIKPAWESTTMG